MPKITINKPSELVDHLVSIFPAFGQEWDEGEAFGYDGDYTYHTVFLALGPQNFKLLSEASDEQIRKLCSLLSRTYQREQRVNSGRSKNWHNKSLNTDGAKRRATG